MYELYTHFLLFSKPDSGYQTSLVVHFNVLGAAHLIDPDPLASARSKRKFALDTRFTPDGVKVVQLHSRVQVVDTQKEEIVYTPKDG